MKEPDNVVSIGRLSNLHESLQKLRKRIVRLENEGKIEEAAHKRRIEGIFIWRIQVIEEITRRKIRDGELKLK
jgi:hypothetical protein